MRWEDERWIKLYTRDTPDWLAVPLAARCFFYELTRKCDGAGIIRLGKKGVRSLAAAVHGTPEEVAPLLEALLDDGCVVLQGDALVIPNFVPAQEARSSDAARKRTQRERDRDQALAAGEPPAASSAARENMRHALGITRQECPAPSAPVTLSVTPAVTPGHGPSHEVTPGHDKRDQTSPAHPSSTHTSQPEGNGTAWLAGDGRLRIFRRDLGEALGLPEPVGIGGKDPDAVVQFIQTQREAVGDETLLLDCVNLAKKSTTGVPTTLAWFVGWLQKLPVPTQGKGAA